MIINSWWQIYKTALLSTIKSIEKNYYDKLSAISGQVIFFK